MEQCYKCGISEHLANLSNAITNEGIVKICNLCAEREGHPIITKTQVQKEKEEYKNNIQRRLSKTSYLNPLAQDLKKTEQQDAHLKEIIKINFEQRKAEIPQKRDDLIENFHWIVMRARRLKHITQEKLAKELKVSEPVIAAAEKGLIEEEGYDLAHKLETFLSIRIIKPEVSIQIEKDRAKRIGFDPITTKELTINDLIDLKRKKEDEILKIEEENLEKNEEEKNPNKKQEQVISDKNDHIIMGEPTKRNGISQEELDSIIFGK